MSMNAKTEVQQASQQKIIASGKVISDEELEVQAYEYNMNEVSLSFPKRNNIGAKGESN